MTPPVYLYDLETTGLDVDRCEITDRHFWDPWNDHVASSGLVKIQGSIPPEVVSITGITDDMAASGDDLSVFLEDMRGIFDRHRGQTVTFVAQNGDRFDHLILRRLGVWEMGPCRLLDSRKFLGRFQRGPSRSLAGLYKDICGVEAPVVHRARADVLMMAEMIKRACEEDSVRGREVKGLLFGEGSQDLKDMYRFM